MNTAIIYSTRHGCTEKCSILLAEKLNKPELINLECNKEINLDQFDILLIGGSIYAGMINKNLKRFLGKNLDTLLQKKVGLFLCCMEEGEKALEQFNNAFPEKLRNISRAKGFFGGEFDFEQMNYLEKAIIKQIGNIEESYSKINHQAISDFAAEVNMY